jgi:hypothetical protein
MTMAKYKLSSYQCKNKDNYLLYLKGLGHISSKAFNAQGDVSEPLFKEGTSKSLIQRKGEKYDTHH